MYNDKDSTLSNNDTKSPNDSTHGYTNEYSFHLNFQQRRNSTTPQNADANSNICINKNEEVS